MSQLDVLSVEGLSLYMFSINSFKVWMSDNLWGFHLRDNVIIHLRCDLFLVCPCIKLIVLFVHKSDKMFQLIKCLNFGTFPPKKLVNWFFLCFCSSYSRLSHWRLQIYWNKKFCIAANCQDWLQSTAHKNKRTMFKSRLNPST